MTYISKPFIVFWITAILILLDGFFISDPNSVTDINVHDTYYVIAHGLIAEIFAIIFFLLGFGYWLFDKINRNLNQTLTIIHVSGTVGIALIYRIVLVALNMSKIDSADWVNLFIIVTFSIALLVQPIYILNLCIGFIKPRASR
ncbi:hypothetical protein KIH23_13375 [Flavobacterium sp. CYK-55]|uniref:hypothetical protein n=1 Tax=Flavobacterium sp. CYK-55 TaxID=2835529 RepID=UPI001BCB1820|nr:hypothetical protein [Flavobacterium sp. CYK-55]MBS7788293.1 hypothetical protein [Flavobacterium sp. CYK-55]